MVDRSAKTKSADRSQYKRMVKQVSSKEKICTKWYTIRPLELNKRKIKLWEQLKTQSDDRGLYFH